MQQHVVDEVMAADASAALATAESLDDVRAIAPAVAKALDDYMATWGQRAIRYQVAYPTIGAN